MITLKRMRELRGERKRRQDTPPHPLAVATDEADCNGEICTAKDPRTCRVHGISNLAKTDFADKNKGKVDVTDAAYLRNLANSMTMEEVDAEIAKHFNMVFAKHTDITEKSKDFSFCQKVVAGVLSSDTHEVSESEVIASKRCVAATLRYLKETINGIKIPKNMMLLILASDKEGKLAQTVCQPLGDDYAIGIAYSIFDKSDGVTFSHGDFRDNFDCLRHEIFHAIEGEVEIDKGEFYGKIVRILGKKEADEELKKVSRYAYVKRHKDESEAECFSKMTSPDYDKSIHKKIEYIVMNDAKGIRNEK